MTNNEKKVICPACGSDSITVVSKTKIISEPYSDPVSIDIKEYSCSVCEAKGDFVGDNNVIIEKALSDAKKKSVGKIIEFFSSVGISMSAIERSLGLPQRTLTKWKNELTGPSASSVALMNIVRTYPWILEVAQNNFAYSVAKRVHISNAINEFMLLVNQSELDCFVKPPYYIKMKFNLEVGYQSNENVALPSNAVNTSGETVNLAKWGVIA